MSPKIGVAAFMAAPLHWGSWLATPLVCLLGFSTRFVMRLFGAAPEISGHTPDEVQVLVREGMITGGFRQKGYIVQFLDWLPAEGKSFTFEIIVLDRLRIDKP